jgi:5'-nucleotidase
LKKSLLPLFALIVGCSGTPAPAPAPAPPAPQLTKTQAPPQPIVVSVVGTSDVHGHVESLPILGGFLSALRAARGADSVLLVDAGDMFQGTLESNLGEGAAMIKGYGSLGYDAAAIGNHEFDFGPVGPHATAEAPGEDAQGALKQRAADAPFPLLAANIDDAATSQPIAWKNVRTSTVVTKHGVTIGLIGVTSEDTPRTTIAANFNGLKIKPLVESIVRESQALKKAGATVVVLMSHAGGNCKDLKDPNDVGSCDAKAEIMQALPQLPKGTLDAVVAGHTHAAMAQFVAGVPVVQSFATGRAFGRIDLTIDPGDKHVTSAKIFPATDLRLPAKYEGADVSADAKVASVIAPDVERAKVRKEESLGVRLESKFTRNHGAESAVGNLFADLMRTSHPGADVALTNGGSLRADLPEGTLTYGQLFEAMPFDNRFATVKMKGKDLRAIVLKNLTAESGILSVSGFKVEATCKGGKLDVKLERSPLHAGKRKVIGDEDPIMLVTSDFLATGGDSTGVTGTTTVESTTLRDGFERELRARKGALRPADVFDPAKRRFVFPGQRPVHCP